MYTRLLVPRHKEAGFTLVELLVVITILGILTAIAVPSFIGAKRNGQDTKAQAAARAALAAERTHYVDFQAYVPSDNAANQAKLGKIESNVNWTTTDAESQGAQTWVNTAAADPDTNQVAVVASWSRSESLFCLMNIAATLTTAVNGQTDPGTYYVKQTAVSSAPTYANLQTSCGNSGWQATAAPWGG